jgi:hypothetical protein
MGDVRLVGAAELEGPRHSPVVRLRYGSRIVQPCDNSWLY